MAGDRKKAESNAAKNNKQAIDSEIVAKEGEIFSIKVASNATTGYAWVLKSITKNGKDITQENNNINYIGSEYINPTSQGTEPVVGAGGTQILSFKAVAKGNYVITIVYKRSFESNEIAPIDTKIYTIVVE